MPSRSPLQFSPYRVFDRAQWARLRADTPMTLVERDLEQVRGVFGELSLDEVEEIYLPLSRLVNLYVAASQDLHTVTNRFLGRRDQPVPFIIGIAGSVAVGKSTSARVLRALLARWADHPKVDLVTTDGFLLPNSVLEARGLMERKGFPESYDGTALLRFLSEVKAGQRHVRTSHHDLANTSQLVANLAEEFVLGTHAAAMLSGVVVVRLHLANLHLFGVELQNFGVVVVDPDHGVEQGHGGLLR